jgi:large subunit ribosomal protein L4
VVIDELKLEKGKTKEMVSFLSNLKSDGQKVLFVLDKADEKIRKASQNMANLRIISTSNLNAYLVMWSDKLIVTEAVLKFLAKGRS